MRNKFTTLISTAVPLPIENIDTDQIIPARFLKATTREGFGANLFRDWRYDDSTRRDTAVRSLSQARTSAAARAASTPHGPSPVPGSAP